MPALPSPILRLSVLLPLLPLGLWAQEASVSSSVAPTGQGAITIEARGVLPKPAPVYTADASAEATVFTTQVNQVVQLKVRILQGIPEKLSFGIRGTGDVRSVKGANLKSWSVRRQGEERFLDIQLKAERPKTVFPALDPQESELLKSSEHPVKMEGNAPQADPGKSDPSDVWLRAWMIMREGEDKEQAQSDVEALSKYLESQRLFDFLVRTYPQWKANMLQYRRNALLDKIEALRAKLKQAPQAPAESPRPQASAVPPNPPALPADSLTFTIEMQITGLKLPATQDLAHLTAGDSAGFTSKVTVLFGPDTEGRIQDRSGFVPLQTKLEEPLQLHLTSGGRIALQIARKGGFPPPAELSGASLTGAVREEEFSVSFTLRGTVEVREPDAMIPILRGQATILASASPTAQPPPRTVLTLENGRPTHQIRFPAKGSFPIQLEIAAALVRDGEWRGFDFEVLPGATVLPITLAGLPADVEFRPGSSIAPPDAKPASKALTGHLPASGKCRLSWKPKRQAGESKLFFTSSAFVETGISTGAIHQDHSIDLAVLQGELAKLDLVVEGDGEILAVESPSLLAWNPVPPAKNGPRHLSLTLSRPVKDNVSIHVRTHSPISSLPAVVHGTRITPVGTLRHSGYLRVSNQGSVSVQPSTVNSLIQLAPEQLPVKRPLEARQIFVYRFPSANYSADFAVAQVQPEINVSQQTVYRITEAEKAIQAEIELDIREAPIRETNLHIPSDYSVVSITGAGLVDYVVSSEATKGQRSVRVIYGEDVTGRQLLKLSLEKNEPAAGGSWTLPALGIPAAKSVRGDIGVAAAPGFHLAVGPLTQLVEKPLASFPVLLPDLQLAFRVREANWSASIKVETLPRNVQADVFHLFTLRDHTAFASVLINYFVTGSPVSEWEVQLPPDAANAANVAVDGRDIRTWRVEKQHLLATLQQPVMGPYTLLVTYERKLPAKGGIIRPGEVVPLGIATESGYLQVVSPVQLSAEVTQASPNLLRLDPLELPAEFQLLSSTPAHATFQYTSRPFTLELTVDWFTPGNTIPQIVEFADVSSRVSSDGELVSELTYFVKSRGQHNLRLRLPENTRLWSAAVDRQPVSALLDGDATLIPLPGGADLNKPSEVRIQLGAAAQNPGHTRLDLPLVSAPVLKTEWTIQGDESKLLVPTGGTVRPVQLPRPQSGFTWIGRHALGHSVAILILASLGIALARRRREVRLAGIVLTLIAATYSVFLARQAGAPVPTPKALHYSLPSLSPDEAISIQVSSMSLHATQFSATGLATSAIGLLVTIAAGLFEEKRRRLLRTSGIGLTLIGLLTQPRGAAWFYLLTATILVLLILPAAIRSIRLMAKSFHDSREARRERKRAAIAAAGSITNLLFLGALALSALASSFGKTKESQPEIPPGYTALDGVEQSLTLTDENLTATGTARLTGREGDRFLLLRAPAVLTEFQGANLRLAKQPLPGGDIAYVLYPTGEAIQTFTATFAYRQDLTKPGTTFSLPTGIAASQKIALTYGKPGWRFTSPAQAGVLPGASSTTASSATLLLTPQPHPQIERKLQERDPSREEMRYFVDAEQLFTVSPGVVDGRHVFEIRPSQGQVTALKLTLPEHFTVSEVSGPVDSWQFDAATRLLQVSLNAPQSSNFKLTVDTQGSLDPLPAETSLSPVLVPEAAGQAGLVAFACGTDAQLESIRSDNLATVPVSDFAGSLFPKPAEAPQQVYRYNQRGGAATLRALPVAPQIRVTTQEILSVGEERLVLSVTAEAEITRAGVFELRFPLPAGLEVESLTGPSLHHWSELEQEGRTWIVLHLQGKTLGRQTFALSLAGNSPPPSAGWPLPRVSFADVTRQTGQIVIKPAPGLRLRAVSRRNVSEIDPRSLGGQGRDAIAFRLLQTDWEVQLGIEQLEPWITGQALHEITLREGQSRSVIHCKFQVENASIRTLRFHLTGPGASPEARKTVRATGKNVSTLIQPDPADLSLWELQFKRRILGEADFRIEFEQRQERKNGEEAIVPAQFPNLRQLAYYQAVRGGGRIDISLPGDLPQGWQVTDWSSVPPKLRTAGNRDAPVLTLRAVDVTTPLNLKLQRHSLAEALKLRVSRGTLTTVLSPLGDELTSVDLQLDVVQRSSLTMSLPPQASLFNIFVNRESIHAVQQNGAFQFYVLPGADDRTATVRFVFAIPGRKPYRIQLTSPRLNVPLENVQWDVVLPQNFTLSGHEGNLELKELPKARNATFTKQSYLQLTQDNRSAAAQQKQQLLDQANKFIQEGKQQRARRTLSAVNNGGILDAASNEDARVQLENLQTQQAVVGLNTRRQRLYLDNNQSQLPASDQVEAAISSNRILNDGEIDFKPQDVSQILQGNSSEDNSILQRIAARLVQHQKSTEPAPPCIATILPEEGTTYTFRRTVQVNENAPLELRLRLASTQTVSVFRGFLLAGLLLAIAGAIHLLLFVRVIPKANGANP